MTFPFLLYKFLSNPRSESSFSYFIILHLYLHIPIKFLSLYLANFLLFICDFRLYFLSCVSLFSASAKFANLEFAVFLKADSISGACEGISIILNFFTYTLAILSALNMDAVL